MKTSKNIYSLGLTLCAAAVLTACGGGGGGGSPAASASTVVSGTASKGLLKGAKVTAYCGLKASNVVVGTATTDTTGNYSLTLTSACSQPLEIEVTTVAGTTKMLDEVKGEIDAPTGFSMRALVNASSGTITQPVTPFTDMAAAVAKNAVSNGQTLSASLVNNSNTAIITNVLGGNAGIFTATPVPPSQYASVSADQQKLITLLSAISASAAASGGTGTDAEKIQTTLTNLASQAVATVPTVTATGYTVDKTATTTPLTTLSSGLTALSTATLADSTTSVTIKASATTVQTTVVDTASTTIANSTTAPVTTPDSTAQTAIAKAQLLFQTIRANLLSIANDANTGLLQSKATDMATDFNNASPVSNFAVGQMVSAMNRAVEYLIEVKTAGGDPSVLGEQLKTDTVFGNHFERTWGFGGDQLSYMKCRVYTTTGSGVAAGATPARPPMLSADNVSAGVYGAVCSFFPYANDANKQVIFAVKTPSTGVTSPATFAYVNKIRTYSAGVCDFSQSACLATDSTASNTPADITYTTGSITASWDSNSPTGATLPTGSKLVSMDGTNATTANLNMSASVGSSSGSVSVNGSIAAGNLLSMSILPGSSVSATMSSGSTDSASASFLGQLDTANFRYNGTFTANLSSMHSVSGPVGTAGFSGKISTLASGVASPFLEGTISANSSTKVAAFSAKVTDGSKANAVAGSLNGSNANQTTADITYTFPGYSMSFVGTRDNVTPSNSTMTVTASDGTKIVSTNSGTVVQGSGSTTTIGTVASGGRVNFTDGTYFVMN